MADKPQTTDPKPAGETPAAARAPAPAPAPAPTTPPRRGPGHRGTDARDAMAEMAAKAQEISLEAGSKVAAAMRDVIYAAAGIAGFAVESARDLVQYMVRRGQMSQEDAEKLIREAEEANARRPKPAATAGVRSPSVPAAAVETTSAARAGAGLVPRPALRSDVRPELGAGTVAARPSGAVGSVARVAPGRPTPAPTPPPVKAASRAPATRAEGKRATRAVARRGAAAAKGASKGASRGAAKGASRSAAKGRAKSASKSGKKSARRR